MKLRIVKVPAAGCSDFGFRVQFKGCFSWQYYCSTTFESLEKAQTYCRTERQLNQKIFGVYETEEEVYGTRL